MGELSAAVKFISDKLDTSNCLIEDIKKELAAVKKENIELRIKNDGLTAEVDDLREREIICAIKDVGVALGVGNSREPDRCRQQDSFLQTRSQPLNRGTILKQVHQGYILTKFREKKTLTANQVNPSLRSQKVYINEHLSPANKLLLAKLKQKAKEAGYAYVWVRDGKFFIRRSAGEKCLKINSYDDFVKIK
ncbi:hypothetical protein J6590_069518 [Homalodisca vitripennis]|nr:hypothetical protein J6590_069518 [Homalodisca vitripennis]